MKTKITNGLVIEAEGKIEYTRINPSFRFQMAHI